MTLPLNLYLCACMHVRNSYTTAVYSLSLSASSHVLLSEGAVVAASVAAVAFVWPLSECGGSGSGRISQMLPNTLPVAVMEWNRQDRCIFVSAYTARSNLWSLQCLLLDLRSAVAVLKVVIVCWNGGHAGGGPDELVASLLNDWI
ncbi:unnamed protein product [Taenia asiatica]|uniref:Mcl1_mid domain-containing protein n=1 Tax=Taenia asiatica TaxID=60517 RepID=A0A0R3VWB3_TAEAS|nr:unnamed protein product [Taenia asiatica]